MKQSRSSIICRTIALAMFAFLLVGAANAQTSVQAGIDAFQTLKDGGTFVNLNLPRGFFCPGSDEVNEPAFLEGVPLTTNPPGALSFADTVVELLKGAELDPGSCATIPLVVRALSLVGSETLNVFCPATGDSQWTVEACTCGCCGVQPITEITLCDDGSGCGCGTFEGELKVNVCLKFRNKATGAVLGPVQKQVNLSVGGPWCNRNPGGVFEAKGAVMLDTNCDQQADLAVACTNNFFPGATCGGPACPPDVCHEGPDHPHCVNPVCDRKQ